ncbi:DUF4350 domain-containing protein [Streptomyces sp. NPDC051320]|uniref:DUF4350 domain-containing protein n=1 Tax=Streptomyces sp. NPDC051320 TaxID=3154644 RepID=UPI00343EDF88
MTEIPARATSLSVGAGQVWKRARGLLLALVVLLAAAVALAAVRSGERHGSLDPRSSDRYGSRAVAELLKDRGVSIRVVTTSAAAMSATRADTTLLIVSPDQLTDPQKRSLHDAALRARGRTVLVGAGPLSVATLAPRVQAADPAAASARTPKCSLPAAARAGKAFTGGVRYTTTQPGADACYPSNGLPTVLRVPVPGGGAGGDGDGDGDGDTVLLGSADILYNHRLDQQGNASLALQLLGSRPHLVWYLPSLGDASATQGGHRSFFDLIPTGWLWATLQLSVAAVLAAIWRARRLGPLVSEQLPVAIRASESAEGRARLYRKTNARDRAASVLRSATRTRLAPLLGVPAAETHSPDALLPAVSVRLSQAGREYRALLFGPPPADDAALVRLADQLDALEKEIRSS